MSFSNAFNCLFALEEIDGTPLDTDQTITAYVETEVAYDPVEGKPGEKVSIVVETIQGDNNIKICPFIDINEHFVKNA